MAQSFEGGFITQTYPHTPLLLGSITLGAFGFQSGTVFTGGGGGGWNGRICWWEIIPCPQQASPASPHLPTLSSLHLHKIHGCPIHFLSALLPRVLGRRNLWRTKLKWVKVENWDCGGGVKRLGCQNKCSSGAMSWHFRMRLFLRRQENHVSSWRCGQTKLWEMPPFNLISFERLEGLWPEEMGKNVKRIQDSR